MIRRFLRWLRSLRINKPLGPPDKLTERVAFSEMRRR